MSFAKPKSKGHAALGLPLMPGCSSYDHAGDPESAARSTVFCSASASWWFMRS
jgi:hypothetical protein